MIKDVHVNIPSRLLSSLVRNVPILTSIEVSPFLSPTQSAVFVCSTLINGCGKVGNLFLVFPLSHSLAAGAVGMWESRVRCEISKERWEEGKSCLWISSLSTVPSFPQLFFHCA